MDEDGVPHRHDAASDFKSDEFLAEYEKTAEALGGYVMIEDDGYPSIVIRVPEEPQSWEL